MSVRWGQWWQEWRQRLTEELRRVATWENSSWEQDVTAQAEREGNPLGEARVLEPKWGDEGSLARGSQNVSRVRRVSTQQVA